MSGFGVNDLAEFAARLAELRSALEPPSAPGEFVAYTDGACFGNPRGNGGWAAAFTAPQPWYLFGHLSSTSNNRAEALGILAALEWAPADSSLTTRSDSELTVFQLLGRYKVKANGDIWELIRRTRSEKRITLKAEWVRGHAGDQGNELADRLSKAGALNVGGLEQVPESPLPAPSADAAPAELEGVTAQGEWETKFVKSIRDQLRRGRALSPKQLAVLERMKGRS